MSGGIKIPVGVAFDKGAEDRVIQDFTQQFNKLGDSIARANKQKFAPIDRGSIEDMRRLTAGFESLKKVSGDLNKRLRATGQEKSGFLDVDWSKLYPDQHARQRQMQKAFDYVTGGGRFTAPPAGPGTPAPGGGGQPPGGPRGPGHGRNIVAAGLNAAGPVGGVANRALSAGMSGGIGAGLAGLAGGLAALAIGKLVGSVREKIGAAQNEFIGYDTLKRQLGDVNVSFGVLKESLREASRGLDMTFDEGLKLGQQFARLANLSGDQYRTLGEEVQHAGGFGRSFGMDPSQGGAFFAQMRLSRVTSSVDDSRRLGLMIGEGIAKSGAFAQADQVLEAIASFAQQQARSGMNAANVAGYTGMLTGMIGSGIPGMDPASAAALLGRVNSTFAGGGGAGEAGQNFIYSALGSRLGLDPIQTAILREQGIFGTGAGTFGAGSTWERFASKNPGAGGTGIAGASTATNLELVMEHFRKNYSGRPELMVNAMSNLFGVNNSQAMALSTIDPKQLGGLAEQLQRAGVNINDVNATGISRLAQLHASGASDDQLKAVASQNQEETDGSRTRATINGVERAIQDMAGKLVPIMNDVRAGIMYIAGEGGKRGPKAIMESVLQTESAERAQQIKRDAEGTKKAAGEEAEKARRAHQGALGELRKNYNSLTPEQLEAAQKNIQQLAKSALEADEAFRKSAMGANELRDKLLAENEAKLKADTAALWSTPGANDDKYAGYRAMSDGESRRRRGRGVATAASSDYDDLFAEAGRMYGVDPALLKTIGMKESGLNPNAVGKRNENGTQDFGLMQHNSRYLADRGITNPFDARQSIFAAAKFMRQNLDAAKGNTRTAVRMYNGSGPKAEAYADDVMSRYTPMPEAGRPVDGGAGGVQRLDISGTFNLVGQNGQPAAAPVHVATKVGRPMAAGTGG